MLKKFIIITIGILLLAGCSQSFGETIQKDLFTLHYTEAVTKGEAQKLFDYLIENKIVDGKNSADIQLTKKDSTYIMNFIVKTGLDRDEDIVYSMSLLGADISEQLFDGASFDIHLCDSSFKTLRVVLQAY